MKGEHTIEIRLRALEPSDVDLLYRWENDPEVWHISNTYTPFSRYVLERYIESSHLDIYQVKQLRLMIDVNDLPGGIFRPVGTIDLFDFEPFHNRAGVGILIGEASDRKKGYAGLALEQFIRYCFNILQLHQIYCNITENNRGSLRLFRSYGFRITGRKVHWIKSARGYHTEYVLQLINPSDAM